MSVQFQFLLIVLIGVAPGAALAQAPAKPPIQIRPVEAQSNANIIEPLPPPNAVSPPIERPSVPPQAMTLDQFAGIALSNNPTLAQASARVQAARGRWIQAGLYPNPTIAYQGDEIGNNGKSGFQGGSVTQEVVRGHKLGLSQSVADREVAQAQQQYESQRYRVMSDVQTQFYEVLLAQRAVELTNQIVQTNSQAEQSAKRLYEVKEASGTDVLQAGIEADMADLELSNARNRYSAAWRKLTAVAGVPTMCPSPLAGDLQAGLREYRWNETLAHLLQCSPELAAARANVESKRAAVSRAIAEPTPNLMVMAGAQHDNASGYDVTNVQIGIPLPIFNRNQGNIHQAEADLSAAQADVGRLELELQSRLASTFERYNNSRQQVAKYSQRILPNSKTALDLANSSYRAGERNFLTVLTAQRTYTQTNLAYVNALRELWQTNIAIDNFLLTDSLQAGDSGESRMNSTGMGSK